jgi:quercetin dioxygenase-like cupin family protein
MHIKRLAQAASYKAPNHFEMSALRLQGFETAGPKSAWVGLSYFLPGGGAGPDSSALEKTYIVLAGSVTVRANGEEVILGPLDSCYIPPNEEREVRNLSNEVASMLVVMPYPAASK